MLKSVPECCHWNAAASGTLLTVSSRRRKFLTTPACVLKGSSYKIQLHDEIVCILLFPVTNTEEVYDEHLHMNFSYLQTSTGMFGLGNSQTRCIKSYSTAPIADVSRLNPMRLARLIWINNRTVSLMLADGSETRFNI